MSIKLNAVIMEQKFVNNNRMVMFSIVGFYILLLIVAVVFTLIS
jgi:hypothetical protein